MIKLPVVLILSEGKTTPQEIVNNLRKIPEDEEKEVIFSDSPKNINGYILHLTTKYYKADLYLVPFEGDINLVPPQIQESTECVLIFFDSGKRSFSSRIPMYAEYLKENEIELGVLLCGRLYDDSNEGITYKDAKQASRFLDVIELDRTRDEDEEDDPHDPLGYDELMQALKGFIWSHVTVWPSSGSRDSNAEESPKGEVSKSSADGEDDDEDPVEMIFEKLLTEAMMFKNSSSSWSRNERLAYAEKFADKFESLIGDGKLSSDDEGA